MNVSKRSNLSAILDWILEQGLISVVFQPIVSFNKRTIIGFEGLSRGIENSPLHDPNALFHTAMQEGRLCELELLCCTNIIHRFAQLHLPGRLFLNLNQSIFENNDVQLNQTLLLCLQQEEIGPGRIVLEITENIQAQDNTLLLAALNRYRAKGFRIALDDLGERYSGLKLWSETDPDYIKIDRHFIQNVNQDKTKRQFIKAILQIANSQRCKVIAEGAETKDEYTCLRKLGIELAQGYYFGKPQTIPNPTVNPELFSQRQNRPPQDMGQCVFDLIQPTAVTVPPSKWVEEVGELFQLQNDLRSIVVVEHGRPLGLVLRNDLMNLLASRYGRDLYGRKAVDQFIHPKSIIVDKQMRLEEVSQHITSNPDCYSEEFIITDNGAFIGKAGLLDLLRKITDFQIITARHSNPLTLLPGNILIQQTLQERLEEPCTFAVAYCDLDNFKAYNDVYGYGHGDEIIRLVGRLAQEFIDPEEDFVGHIGGDDFILIFRSLNWLQRCQDLSRTFEEVIPEFYSAKDRAQQGIESTDRHGVKRTFPIMTLSIGVLAVENPHQHLAIEQIPELASNAKSNSKKEQGNSIFVDTLRHPDNYA